MWSYFNFYVATLSYGPLLLPVSSLYGGWHIKVTNVALKGKVVWTANSQSKTCALNIWNITDSLVARWRHLELFKTDWLRYHWVKHESYTATKGLSSLCHFFNFADIFLLICYDVRLAGRLKGISQGADELREPFYLKKKVEFR